MCYIIDRNYKIVCFHDSCLYDGTESLSDLLNDLLNDLPNDIPSDGYGIYVFRKNSIDGPVLYIGKGGTFCQYKLDKNTNIVHTVNQFKTQKLSERIQNKHKRGFLPEPSIPTEQLFKNALEEDKSIHSIVIEWYIIDESRCLPAFVEAMFIQDYYSEHGTLPPWNSEF